MIGILYAWTGLFSPRAGAAEKEDWTEHGRAIADMSAYGFADPLARSGARPAAAE